MLDARKLVEALLAVAGIWLLFRQLPDYTATLYVAFFSEDVSRGPLLAIQSIHFAASIVFGFLLIAGRSPIARRLTPAGSQASIGRSAIVAAGTAVVATYFMISGVIELGTSYMTASRLPNEPFLLWRGIFSFVSGLLLFLCSASCARLWSLLERRNRHRA